MATNELQTAIEQEWRDFVPPGRAGADCRQVRRSWPAASLKALEARGVTPAGSLKDPDRRAEWAEGKSATLDLIDRLQAEGAGSGKVLTGLTHSGGWVVAVGFAPRVSASGEDEVAGVGVDLERSQRKPHPDLVKRLVTAEESVYSLRLIEHWTIKEACFKAHPANEGSVVWQYRLRSFDPASGSGFAAKEDDTGGFRIRFKLLKQGDWLVGLAYSIRNAR